MTPNAIYSKSGKGVQEASGKTSLLSRGDRSVLSAFDGKLTVSEVAQRVGKPFDAKFQQLILQLDKDGFVREVTSGAAPAASAKPAAAPAKPAAAAPPKSGAPGPDLDFTIAIPASPPPKPKAPAGPPPVDQATKARAETERKHQEDNMARARREAEEKAQKERDRVKSEAEDKIRAETEVKLRAEAEQKAKSDAENKVKADAEAKAKEAREAAVRVALEAKARAEAAANAKLEAERAKIREEAEKAKREAEELRQRLEEERKAREAEERKRKDEEEKRRKEEEARRKQEDERRAQEEAERKAREAEERARRENEEKERKAAEREAQAARERAEQEARMRQAREDNERRQREKEERAASGGQAPEPEKPKAKEKAPAAAGFDSLMADLDSFSDRDEADKKAKEEAERKEKEEKKARKAREEAEQKAKEEAEEARKEAEEKARKDEKKRKEEEERRAKEEEEENAKREAEERKRKAREAAAAKEAGPKSKSDDIGVSDDDLDMDDVKADQEAVSKESRKAQREREREAKEREREARERARERERESKREASGAAAPAGKTAYKPFRRKKSWGKPVAVTLFFLLVAAVGVVHVMPISTAEYEKAASEAIGQPVKIGAARLSLYSGVQLNLEGVSVAGVRIASVRAFPEIGSLFDDKKAFSRIELDGVSLPQEALWQALAAKLRGPNFSVARLNIRQLKLPGPLAIPTLEADVSVITDGSVGVIMVRGPDSLAAKLTPSGSSMDFDVTASGFTLPFLPDVTLSTFAMKGRATGDGARIESWGGASLDGAINGTANVRWGANWTLDGSLTVRGINAAVFAPALLSEGKAEGTGRFSMSDPDPASFKTHGRVEGTFALNKGVLGSFDLSRAIQTGGRQATGRSPFTEMNGQGVFDKGAVALRGVTFSAGAMNASASADITPEGALSGRIIADIRTSSQNLRATVNIGGTIKEPQVK